MKNLFVLTLIIIIAFLTSCTKEEFFSCDPDANSWAKNNLSEIREMQREDWVKIGEPTYQLAAFVAFIPEQRFVLWNEKLNETLLLDWTAQEKRHIEALITLINENPDIFSNDHSEELMDKINIELYKWAEYSKDFLKWEQNTIFAVAGTPHRLTSNKEIAIQIANPILKSGSETDCNCNQTSSFCTPFTQYCQSFSTNKCKESSFGCGLLWVLSCNGLCKSI